MNRLHVYTGKGKGKTTAAMGLAVRSLGHGNCVLIGQFVKDGRSGELAALALMPGAVVCPCAPLEGFVFRMTPQEKQCEAQKQTAYAAALASQIVSRAPQTIILDELGMALELGMLPESDARALLETALRYGETVVTGRAVPAWLLEKADYITRMEPVRHPYETEKLQARKGVEW